jgi:Glycosyltransferase family 87
VPVVPSTVLTDRLRVHRIAPSSSAHSRWASWPEPARRSLEALSRLSPEGRDAFLYGCSALFAGFTAFVMGIPLYRQWGQMAVGFYGVAAGLMAYIAWRVATRPRESMRGSDETPPTGIGSAGTAVSARRPAPSDRRRKAARVIAFAIVLFGATILPLTMEVIWRSQGNAALHVQPEVLVVEQAGVRAAHGKDPYQVVDRNGHILIHQTAEPTYELYYPYLPGMVVFGFSSGSKVEARLTDARIQFLLFTALVALLALSRLRPPTDARARAFQVITALPTAALPLATGGDDMPVVALMLLGLVALQRRRPVLAGLALGAASSLKFSAWPLVVLALWAAYDLRRHRAIGRYALGVLAVVVPVVVPVALHNPSAFVDNVIRFPLGIAGVHSPAASALPGHILISVVPSIHRAYVVVAGLIGGLVLIRRLIKKPPRDAADVASLTGWVMLIALLLAPATRVGYLLYPINLFIWAWMLRRAADPAVPHGGKDSPPAEAWQGAGPELDPSIPPVVGQPSSDRSNSWRENGVVPVAVVGDTTAPTSQ